MKPAYLKYQTDFQKEKGKSHLLEGHEGQSYNSSAFVLWLIETIEAFAEICNIHLKTIKKRDKHIKELEATIQAQSSKIGMLVKQVETQKKETPIDRI